MEVHKLEKEKLLARAQKVKAAWAWPFDAIVLVTGKTSDDAQEYKALAMHHYLLGIEFPETAILLLKSGTIVFLTSAKKVEFLRQVEGPGVELLTRGAAAPADDANLMRTLEARLRGDKKAGDKVVVGMLLREKHIGPWADAFVAALSSQPALEVVECREEVSDVLAVKDEPELKLSERAALAAHLFMDACAVTKVEEVIDRELKQTNREVCTLLEAEMENEALMKEWADAHKLDAAELDLVYVSVQSGKQFDLKPGVEPTDDGIPMEGTYLLSAGMKYAEYSACLCRTLLVDPTSTQKEAYYLACEVQSLVIACLKPGVVFKDIYVQARKQVEKKKPEFMPLFVKSVGFSMGLEFKDPQMQLTEKSERKVLSGMVFCVSVGFAEAGTEKPWAVWVGDTAHVLPEGSPKNCVVHTEVCSKKPADRMYELGEPDAQQQPQQPAAPTLPVATEPGAEAKAPEAAAAKAKGKAKAQAKKSTVAKAAPPPAKPEKAAKKQQDRKSQKKPEKPQKSQAEREAEASYATAASEVLRTKRAAKMEQTQKDIAAQLQLEQRNVDIREKRFQEIRERFSGSGARLPEQRETSKLSDCVAYKSAESMPANLRPNRLQIDMTSEVLLAPVCGAIVPFHLKTIKNMSRSQHDKFQMLRVNFFTPGQGKSQDDYPVVNGQRIYVKELSFRSLAKDNLDTILRTFKEMQKRGRQRDLEDEVHRGEAGSGMGEAVPLQILRSFHCLRDVYLRPSPGGRGRSTGTLEAHSNGFRFSMKAGAEKLDVLYSRVQHAIFQPCEGNMSNLVVLHFHLKEPMMVGKKKSQDLQFYAEIGSQTEDLSMRKVGNAHDPDEILEEQREREWKERLNHLFLDFTKKVQAISSCPLNFDMPYTALQFAGVPFKTGATLFPCERVLVSITEWPPFCLDLDSIDIAVFERCMTQLKEFDLVFVLKDYDQSPVRVTTVPNSKKEIVRGWLVRAGIPVYNCSMNMAWAVVMREINTDRKKFVEEGGWDPWFMQSEDEDEASGAKSEEDDIRSDDFSDASEDAASSSGAEAWEPSDSEDSDSGESEPSDAESWEELERKADRADKKRDAEKRQDKQQKLPDAKRRRR